MTPDLVRNLARLPRRLAFTTVLAMAGPGLLGAQVATGAITGVIRDSLGAPIANAQVRILTTAYATAADPAGKYTFANVPVGTYTIRAHYVGYKPKEIKEVRILSGQRLTLDITLTATATEIHEISVVAANNALVPRDQATSKQLIDGIHTDKLPVEKLDRSLALQPGVIGRTATSETPIRSGRADAGNTYIDGVPVQSGNRGTGAGRSLPSLQVGTNAFEDASITTGGRSAEFGNAQGGVIAIPPSELTGRQVAPPPVNESYARIHDNAFLGVRENPLSTFGVDVDRASYSNIRRFITAGQRPPPDAVRIEEMLNYFTYDYPEPSARSEHPFTVTTEVTAAPWHTSHQLLRVGLQARRVDVSDLPAANLVFLVDVSGSMQAANKLPLVKRSLRMLAAELRDIDRVAMVVYAGSAGLVLESTAGSAKSDIMEAIDRLQAGGSTAGGAGIRLAYGVARQHFITGGNNRVIIATDGDFNVGAASDADMERLIEAERTHGVFLTVLGFGMGNYKDSKLETLADKGNGNYAYIDTTDEAEKTLVHELGGTLFTVAKDVKLQLEFNPARVASYRLIGYENRLLAREDFDDDTKDAGDIGSDHSVTALYEIVPVGADDVLARLPTDSLRYQRVANISGGGRGTELLFIKLRYKAPDGDASRLLTHVVPNRVQRPSTDMRFAAAVASFGMILRESEHKGSMDIDDVVMLAERSLGEDAHGYRAAFVDLLRTYRGLTTTAD